jgi:hypothetical protein
MAMSVPSNMFNVTAPTAVNPTYALRSRTLMPISLHPHSSDACLTSFSRVDLQKRLPDIPGLPDVEVPRAKAELAKHCTAIMITPEGDWYRIAGDWKLLGGRADGAGGKNSTVLPHVLFKVAA